jgi:mono/diheme cytochrome c family protein
MRQIILYVCAGCLLFAGVARGQSLEDVERFTDGDAAHGAPLYKRYCAGCHGQDGRGGAHTFMPHAANLTAKDYVEVIPGRIFV